MFIVVIDDTKKNQVSAQLLRKEGHVVMVLESAEEAFSFFRGGGTMKPHHAGMVLTDLWMPLGESGIGWIGYDQKKDVHVAKESPFGLVLAIAARNAGVKLVGILTDTNHHADLLVHWAEMLAAPESVRGVTPVLDESRRTGTLIFEARYFEREDGSKDWVKLAKLLIGETMPSDE